jgi:hypothetical protein
MVTFLHGTESGGYIIYTIRLLYAVRNKFISCNVYAQYKDFIDLCE